MLTGRPSIKLIAGITVVLFADVLFATAINHRLVTGTCSSTGYTQYGPAPLCPKGTGFYGAFLAAGIFLVILAAALIGNTIAVATMFVAIDRVTDRFGADANVVALSLYPGELELVIARAGGVPTARLNRFVLSLAQTLAHWDAYVSGNTRALRHC